MQSIIRILQPAIKKFPKPVYNFVRRIFVIITGIKLVLVPPRFPQLSYFQRVRLMLKFLTIHNNIECQHTQEQIISFSIAFMSIPTTEQGCIVEAGVFKGGSSAKFSLAAKYVNRELVLFDSYQGLPENKEAHERSILGHSIKGWFNKGAFCGGLEEVKYNIDKYGKIEVCNFIEGWFDDTMPLFSKKIAAAYLDVDLASSTKTCLKYLYPLIIPGGVLYSQDGDFPLVIEVFNDDEFWEKECGCKKPYIEGLGTQKLIRIIKPLDSEKA